MHQQVPKIVLNDDDESVHEENDSQSGVSKIKEGWVSVNLGVGAFRSLSGWQARWCVVRRGELHFNRTDDETQGEETSSVTTICTKSIIAESSNKNRACSFEVIDSSGSSIEISCQTRPQMEDWIDSIKSAIPKGGAVHTWYTTSHGKPMFCNVCTGIINGLKQKALSCEVCKIKVHRSCAAQCVQECKWRTIEQVKVVESKTGETYQQHQWLVGNIPVNSKCTACKKACGSILRLSEDRRCLWCREIYHSQCIGANLRCSFGLNSNSILKPLALSEYDKEEDVWRARNCSKTPKPMLVFVNSKSGDNKGVQFLRRFRQHLNPGQVYDLMRAGPLPGLNVFQRLDNFQVLICGGDGSISWVLGEMDRLGLTPKTQVGVLPLGTGNDLSQVLGWGDVFNDDTKVPTLLERYACAKTKMLDRWSIMVYEGILPDLPQQMFDKQEDEKEKAIEQKIGNQIANIINSTDPEIVLKASSDLIRIAKHVLDITAERSAEFAQRDTETLSNINLLRQKLNGLEEASSFSDNVHSKFNENSKNNLMNRANSVKNAVKNVLDKAVKSKKNDKNPTRKNPKISPRIKSRPVRRDTSDETSDQPDLQTFLGLNDFKERYVMNNYFGIGVDAKIVLDFHHYRDKNQKNCGRNLNKLSMTLFSANELLKQSHKKLNKKIRLFCDDKEINLPDLQGVLVLNIPSYAAGINFWGDKSGGQSFVTPSYSDRLIEVIGIFGVFQLGMSQAFLGLPQRVSQRHRIAQCSSLKIMIKGSDPIPVQVDGEAWMQKPGIIKIEHKNRVQMLARDVNTELMLSETALTVEEINSFALFASEMLACIESSDEFGRDELSEEKDKIVDFLDTIQISKLPIRYDVINTLIEVVESLCSSPSIARDRKDDIRSKFEQLGEIPWFRISVERHNISKPQRPTVISRFLHPKRSNRDSLYNEMCRLDLPFDIRTWNEESVRIWAESLKISKQSVKMFSENHVIGSHLIYFDSKDLKQMGIGGEDLRRLSDEISELRRLHQRQMKSKSTSDLPF